MFVIFKNNIYFFYFNITLHTIMLKKIKRENQKTKITFFYY